MNEYNKIITGINPISVALFEGVFASALGLGVAVLYSISNTVGIAESTGSVLAGLSFGLATGALAIIVLPLVYFAIGWFIGLLHGLILNWVLGGSGGINIQLSDVKVNTKKK
jgi:hypothetical protein